MSTRAAQWDLVEHCREAQNGSLMSGFTLNLSLSNNTLPLPHLQPGTGNTFSIPSLPEGAVSIGECKMGAAATATALKVTWLVEAEPRPGLGNLTFQAGSASPTILRPSGRLIQAIAYNIHGVPLAGI